MALVASLTTVWPVTTWTPCGRTRAMSRCTWALSAPGWADDVDGVELTHRAQDLLGRRRVERASVAPARLSAVPKRARPEMVNVWVGPCNRIRTGWPT